MFVLHQSRFGVRSPVRTQVCAWAWTGAAAPKDLLAASVRQVGGITGSEKRRQCFCGFETSVLHVCSRNHTLCPSVSTRRHLQPSQHLYLSSGHRRFALWETVSPPKLPFFFKEIPFFLKVGCLDGGFAKNSAVPPCSPRRTCPVITVVVSTARAVRKAFRESFVDRCGPLGVQLCTKYRSRFRPKLPEATAPSFYWHGFCFCLQDKPGPGLPAGLQGWLQDPVSWAEGLISSDGIRSCSTETWSGSRRCLFTFTFRTLKFFFFWVCQHFCSGFLLMILDSYRLSVDVYWLNLNKSDEMSSSTVLGICWKI